MHRLIRNEENKPRICALCKFYHVKTVKGWKVYSRFHCNVCKVPLCKGERDCFDIFHNALYSNLPEVMDSFGPLIQAIQHNQLMSRQIKIESSKKTIKKESPLIQAIQHNQLMSRQIKIESSKKTIKKESPGDNKPKTWLLCESKILQWRKYYNRTFVRYCKTLIISVTLFWRGNQPRFIHETLFSRFVIYSSLILTIEIIGEEFIFASLCSREFTWK